MSKISLNTLVFDMDDKPVMNGDKELRMYDILKIAACNDTEEDARSSDPIGVKQKNFEIFLGVREAGPEGEVELTSEQITHIKPRVAKTFTTLITAQAVAYLEGKDPYGGKRKPNVSTLPGTSS